MHPTRHLRWHEGIFVKVDFAQNSVLVSSKSTYLSFKIDNFFSKETIFYNFRSLRSVQKSSFETLYVARSKQGLVEFVS
jgi:hypothetical protein